MVKYLYTDPIDWDSPQLLRIQSTVVLLCEHVSDHKDVNNTYKVILSFIGDMSPFSTNVDSLRMICPVLLSSSCNTVVTSLQQNIYCRHKAVTSKS